MDHHLHPSNSSRPPANSTTDSPRQNSRKRARSSSSEASSSKRAMSEDPASAATSTDADASVSSGSFAALKLSSASSTQSVVIDEIDSYMQTQEQGQGQGQTTPTRLQGSADDRFQLITRLRVIPLREGDVWYLVAADWFRKWTKACTGKIDKEGLILESQLGPVDNASLFDDAGKLISPLVESVDVEFIPKEGWDKLVEWYGTPSHPLPRTVILQGNSRTPIIELNLLKRQVVEIIKGDPIEDENTYIEFSSTTSISGFYDLVFKEIVKDRLGDENCRFWTFDSYSVKGSQISVSTILQKGAENLPLPFDLGADLSDPFTDQCLDETAIVAFEIMGEDEEFPVPFDRVPSQKYTSEAQVEEPLFKQGTDFFSKLSSSSKNTPSNEKEPLTSVSKFKFDKKSGAPPGLLGLSNMGNTCFMNSALQCLAHTEPLVDYFLTGVFQHELNPTNPLGMQGAIAEVFGALLRRIWTPTTSMNSFAPRDFKSELQRFAPQFSGYQQHDTQELVAFLLDGLHEDLNRVLKKPYVEKPDWEGGGDKELVELARNSWDGYMKRNDSVIVDLFQGQYKSTLVCPECKKVSITFDPFMYLTLPLPIQKKWSHKIYYVPWDMDKPHVQVFVEVNRNASFKEVRHLLGRWMDAEPDNLLTLEVFNNRFYKDLDDNALVGDMTDNDVIVCFELPCHAQQSRTWKPSDDPEKDPIIFPVHLSVNRGQSSMRPSTFRSQPTAFSRPFVIALSSEDVKDSSKIYNAIIDRLQRWTVNERDLYHWEHGDTGIDDQVPIQLNRATTAVTEFKENGDIVEFMEDAPEEGDIVDAKAIILEEDGPEGEVPSSGGDVKRLGPKANLFEIQIQSGTEKYGSGSSWSSSTTWDSLERREVEMEGGSLLKQGDALFCEWDENLRNYYFGEETRFENSRWTQPHWDLFTHPEFEASKAAALARSKKGINLHDCLEEFTKEEQLGEDDLWYCPRCKKHQQATKKFDIWTMPDVLVVHLKRFSNSRVLRDKIDAFVDFPVEGLDLGEYCGERAATKRLAENGQDVLDLGLSDSNEPLVYDLYAVDEHMGGLGGGHYRAYAKHHQNDQWYHFDDSFVNQVRADEAVNPNAYLLFYKRRSTQPLGGKSYEMIEQARQKQLDNESSVQLPTPDEDDLANASSGGKSLFGASTSFRYPTPLTNSHASPSTSLSTPPPEEADPPGFENAQFDKLIDMGELEVLEITPWNNDWNPASDVYSGSNSPSSSTEAIADMELVEMDDTDTLQSRDESSDWPPGSSDPPNSIHASISSLPTVRSTRPSSVATGKMKDVPPPPSAPPVKEIPVEESTLLDIDL